MNFSAFSKRPQHGGQLAIIAEQLSRPVGSFIDLSTGINPHHYSVEGLPESAWTNLPNTRCSEWRAAIRNYYDSDCFTAVPGTQWAIENLPNVVGTYLKASKKKLTVCLPDEGYAEHAYHWLLSGAECLVYEDFPTQELVRKSDICVLINPNNPTTHAVSKHEVLMLHEQISAKGGILVVDEAFVDFEPERSVADLAGMENLIVLRSFGKFTGLAGLRLGFVGAQKSILERFNNLLPLWTISGPAIALSMQVFKNREWYLNMRNTLFREAGHLENLLAKLLPAAMVKKSVLFCTVYLDQAEFLYTTLLEQGVYVRLLDSKLGLRFGLPKSHEWEKLEMALHRVIEVSNEQVAAC